ncbi:MAG TPA: PrsW family glutamic-type intramembrane protease [Dictyobacter sp.]|jgi:RsiW-degrading membrane proteinase PrsW (M82 family)|nr:PrsW family glutamic-type intramembrane protease [Dictyobacter sp.]
MSISQSYGVLRVVQRGNVAQFTKQPANYAASRFPCERLIHLLTRRETMIGRSLSNDLILMDPTVSRHHARLFFDEQGWLLQNLSEQSEVQVNGNGIASGECVRIVPQDFLLLGGTMLQLVAPANGSLKDDGAVVQPVEAHDLVQEYSRLQALPPFISDQRVTDLQQQEVCPQDVSLSHEKKYRTSIPFTQPVVAANAFVTPSVVKTWVDRERDSLLGIGVTLQSTFPAFLRQRARWLIPLLILLMLLLGTVLVITVHHLLGGTIQEGPLNVMAVVTIPIIPALGITLLVNFIDRFEREPWVLRLSAFLWGALISIPATALIEQFILNQQAFFIGTQPSNALRSFFDGLNAGVTEETIKGLGLLLLFFVLRDEFDNVTDGIVYGALIGAGFAMGENFLIFTGNPHSVFFLVIGRIVLGWLSHSTFTAIFGVGLGYIRHTRIRWRHILIPFGSYLLAVGLHTAFDFVNFFSNALILTYPNNSQIVLFSLIASVSDYILPFIAQLGILYCLMRALAHEAAIIREFLAAEVERGVVTVDEYALLQHSFLRTKVERQVFFHHGIKQWWRVEALYQTEIGLAFRKWHVNMGDKPKLGYIQPEDAYRQRIQRLRKDIIDAEMALQ